METVIAHLMNSLEVIYWKALKKETLSLWEGDRALAQVSQTGVPTLGDIQQSSRHGPGEMTPAGLGWAGGLDQVTSRGALGPLPFHEPFLLY